MWNNFAIGRFLSARPRWVQSLAIHSLSATLHWYYRWSWCWLFCALRALHTSATMCGFRLRNCLNALELAIRVAAWCTIDQSRSDILILAFLTISSLASKNHHMLNIYCPHIHNNYMIVARTHIQSL